MKAKDVMTEDVVSVREDASVESIARLLLQRRISAVPVTGAGGSVNVVLEGSVVHLWGSVQSKTQRDAIAVGSTL